MDRSYTLVSAHFGDLYWIQTLLDRINRFSDQRIERAVIVNQDRCPRPELRALARVSEVLEFPVDQYQLNRLGHDHPASLDRALASVEFKTSHVLVMDSDCFPIRQGWLDRIEDITLAGDPEKWGLTHPCFMVFPVNDIGTVNFSEGLREVGLDTGRLVGLRLAQSGKQVVVDRPVRSFNGYAGWTYLEGSVYHHGSGSFSSASSSWMNRQVDPRIERWLRARIDRDQFSLTDWEVARLVVMKVASKLRRTQR